MGFKKFFKKAAGIALPVIGGAIGGPIGAAAGGALGGAIQGKGLKGIATGAALGGAGGLGASALGGMGGGAGGFSKLLTGGGFNGGMTGMSAGNQAGGGMFSKLLSGGKSLLGSSLGSPMGGNMQGPTMGSGVKGLFGRFTNSMGGQGGGHFSSLLKGILGGGEDDEENQKGGGLGSLLSGGLDLFSQYDNMRGGDRILQGYRDNLSPYSTVGKNSAAAYQDALNTGKIGAAFNPQNLENEVGYKFAREQGEQALDRLNAARGGLYSGAAAKEAMRFNQGLADQNVNNAYNRFAGDQDRLSLALQNGMLRGMDASTLLAAMQGKNTANRQRSKTGIMGMFSGLLGG